MNYTSDNFQLHQLSTYKLFVNTDFSRDTLLVLDDKQTVQAFYSYTTDSPDSDAIKLLALPFNKVYINVPVQSLLLLPAEVFKEEDSDLYREFLQDENQDRTLIHHFEEQQIVACFQYDMMLYNKWSAIFPEAIHLADFQTTIKNAPLHCPAAGELLGLHIKDMYVELYVYKDGQAQLYTLFEVATADDLAYFMLHTLQSLSLPAKVSQIVVSGVDANHEYARILPRFSDTIKYLTTQVQVQVSDEVVKAAIATFDTLIDTELCV